MEGKKDAACLQKITVTTIVCGRKGLWETRLKGTETVSHHSILANQNVLWGLLLPTSGTI